MLTLTDSGMRVAFEEAARTLARGLGADRAAVLYLGPDQLLAFGGAYGLAEFAVDDAPISISLVKSVIAANSTVIYSNIGRDQDARGNLSLQLSGAVSVLCIPFYDSGGAPRGALYADTRKKTAAFRRQELLFARDCASWLEGCLAGTDYFPRPEREAPRPAAKPAPTPAEKSRGPRRAPLPATCDDTVPASALMVCFRSLATLTAAGVLIHDSLDLLAGSSEDRGLGRILSGLSQAVRRGEPLSGAMERYPLAFPSSLRATVRIGERSGRLVRVLDVLSTDLEKQRRLVYRVRSALTYPAILSVFCALLLLLGPPFLLEGHFRMLTDSGVSLPPLSRAMAWLSTQLRGPVFLPALLLALLAGATWVAKGGGAQKCWRLARRGPLLGPILELVSMTQLSRSLSLQLKAGMMVLEALEQAQRTCRDEALQTALRQVEARVRNGDSMAEAFRRSEHFSATFVSFVEAGESSGTLPDLAERLADLTEQELDSKLEGLVALAEPVVLFVMGVAAAILMLATLQPSLALLQTL